MIGDDSTSFSLPICKKSGLPKLEWLSNVDRISNGPCQKVYPEGNFCPFVPSFSVRCRLMSASSAIDISHRYQLRRFPTWKQMNIDELE